MPAPEPDYDALAADVLAGRAEGLSMAEIQRRQAIAALEANPQWQPGASPAPEWHAATAAYEQHGVIGAPPPVMLEPVDTAETGYAVDAMRRDPHWSSDFYYAE